MEKCVSEKYSGGKTNEKKDYYHRNFNGNQVKANTGYMIDPADIVDWNTDGKELSLCMSDGSECYAYKQEECFNVKKRDYLALKDISEVRATSKGFYIIDTDGDEYFFER